MKKTTILFLLNVIAILILSNYETFACSCMGTEKPSTEFRKTPIIFVGTVKSVNSADSKEFGDSYNFNDLRTTFFVDEAIKGVKTKEIDVYTSSQGTACGISFQKGKQYLVYADNNDEKRKYYTTSICSRTRLTEDKEDEIAVLRSLAKGRFEPRIYGRVEEIVRGIFLLDDKDNVPMSNIKVIARSLNFLYEETTDENGRFSFKNLKPGNYRLEVKLPATHKVADDSWGFKEKQKTDLDFTVTNTDCPDFITIETRVDGRIKGRVFDFQGNAVGKDVRITLVTKNTVNNSDDKIEYIGVDTDNKGYYEFEGIPAGEYYLGVNLDMRQPYKDNPYPKTFYPNASDSAQATLIKLGFGQKLNGFDLFLPKPLETLVVKGKVLRENGEAAKGVTVYVSNQARHNFEDFVWLKTDENGEFSVSCLKGLFYRFTIYEKDSRVSERIEKIGETTNYPLIFEIKN